MSAATFDPYATLGIPVNATREEAARAHRGLAKQFHPDVNPGPAAAERMRRINAAWRILSNPAQRARHDAERSSAAPGPGPGCRPEATRASAATWTAWPESRRSAPAATRQPLRQDAVEPSFGDRPAVVVAVSVALALLYFIGSWLGSAP